MEKVYFWAQSVLAKFYLISQFTDDRKYLEVEYFFYCEEYFLKMNVNVYEVLCIWNCDINSVAEENKKKHISQY